MENKLNIKLLLMIVVIVIVILAFVFFIGKGFGKKGTPKRIPLPKNGEGIPLGWTATPDTVALYSAMKGLWTDENMIWNTLEGKTPDQLAAVYNEFGNRYKEDLFDWFRDDLSGGELSRALNYFKGIV